MLLHTIFLSDDRLFPPLFERSSYDLQSDDTAEPPPPLSSKITNNCSRSTLIFHTRPQTRCGIGKGTNVLMLNRGRRVVDAVWICYKKVTRNPDDVKDQNETFASVWYGSSEPSSSISRKAFSLLRQRCPSLFAENPHFLFPFHFGVLFISSNSAKLHISAYMLGVRNGYYITCPVVERVSLLPIAWAPVLSFPREAAAVVPSYPHELQKTA